MIDRPHGARNLRFVRAADISILVVLLAFFLGSEIYLYRVTHGYPAMLDQSETSLIFLAGRNFARFGILHEWLTPDFATGSSSAAHPMYYTHYADFTVHFSYVLFKAGVTSIPGQIAVGIVVLLIGLYVMYLAVADYIDTRRAAHCVLFVSVIDYCSVIVSGLNIHKNWAWLVVFAPLWLLRKHSDTQGNGFFWTGTFTYSLLSYYDYGLAIYVTVMILCLKVFSFYEHATWKIVVTFVALGTIPSFILHSVLVIGAVGPIAFWHDVRYTFLNRIAGTVSRQEMMQFYQTNGIVLWGYNDPASLSEDFRITVGRIVQLFGSPACWIVGTTAAVCMGLALMTLNARSRRDGTRIRFRPACDLTVTGIFGHEDIRAMRFIAASMFPLLVMFPLLHIQMTVLYASAWAPLYVFPFTVTAGLALSAAWRATMTLLARKSLGQAVRAIPAALAIIAIASSISLTQYRHVNGDVPISEFPGHKALTRYAGRTFATNYQAAYVSCFTNEWAQYRTMATLKSLDFRMDPYIKSYVFERDIALNEAKYNHPEFAFIIWHDDPSLAVQGFPLIEHGPGYWIYDLRDQPSAEPSVGALNR
jgi:hypothetical protein